MNTPPDTDLDAEMDDAGQGVELNWEFLTTKTYPGHGLVVNVWLWRRCGIDATKIRVQIEPVPRASAPRSDAAVGSPIAERTDEVEGIRFVFGPSDIEGLRADEVYRLRVFGVTADVLVQALVQIFINEVHPKGHVVVAPRGHDLEG